MTRDVTAELKSLRLHGMAGAWVDLAEQGTLDTLESSRWLVEHLLQAESTDRASICTVQRWPTNEQRIIVSAWNVAELPKMALMPCHALFQFYVAPGDSSSGRAKLSCQLYQRSADIFLGVPFNIASYALLTHMLAQQCDMDVGDFIWTGGDCHIYGNHHDQVRTQLAREARPYPTLVIKRRPASIFDYEFEDFEVQGYDPDPAIKGAVAV